jgi:hypothetical protein
MFEHCCLFQINLKLMRHMLLNFPSFHVCSGISTQNYCSGTSIHIAFGSLFRAPNNRETGNGVAEAAPELGSWLPTRGKGATSYGN